MARPKKEASLLHCRLDKKLSDELNVLCAGTGLTRTAAVERALRMYIEEFKKTGRS